MSHPDSIGITHRAKTYPVAVASERAKPFRVSPARCEPGAANTSKASHRDKPQASRSRRRPAYARVRALYRLSLLARPGASFTLALAAVRVRYPTCTSERAFEREARAVWEREVAARQADAAAAAGAYNEINPPDCDQSIPYAPVPEQNNKTSAAVVPRSVPPIPQRTPLCQGTCDEYHRNRRNPHSKLRKAACLPRGLSGVADRLAADCRWRGEPLSGAGKSGCRSPCCTRPRLHHRRCGGWRLPSGRVAKLARRRNDQTRPGNPSSVSGSRGTKHWHRLHLSAASPERRFVCLLPACRGCDCRGPGGPSTDPVRKQTRVLGFRRATREARREPGTNCVHLRPTYQWGQNAIDGKIPAEELQRLRTQTEMKPAAGWPHRKPNRIDPTGRGGSTRGPR